MCNIRLKNFSKKITTAILGLATAILIVEMILRIAPHQFFAASFNNLVYFHPTLGHKYKPNLRDVLSVHSVFTPVYVSTNSVGWRDREYGRSKPPNTFRVVVLGDSLSAGMEVPVESTYPKILEEMLNTSKPTNVEYEVMNLAVGGYNLASEIGLYRQQGALYQPDLVIWQIFLGNDLADYPVQDIFNERTTFKDLVKQSYALFALRCLYDRLCINAGPSNKNNDQQILDMRNEVVAALRTYFGRGADAEREQFYISILEHQRLQFVLHSAPIRLQTNILDGSYKDFDTEKIIISSTASVINRFQNELQLHGIPLLVVFAPTQLQVDHELWQLYLGTIGAGEEAYYNRALSELSTIALLSSDVSYLSLRRTMQDQCQKVGCGYLAFDGHWDVDGHKQVANSIYIHLCTWNWFMCP